MDNHEDDSGYFWISGFPSSDSSIGIQESSESVSIPFFGKSLVRWIRTWSLGWSLIQPLVATQYLGVPKAPRPGSLVVGYVVMNPTMEIIRTRAFFTMTKTMINHSYTIINTGILMWLKLDFQRTLEFPEL